jgi:hypothetical protein
MVMHHVGDGAGWTGEGASGMSNHETIQPTPVERRTLRLKARIESHIREWYPRELEKFPVRELYFIISDHPYELWKCEMSRQDPAEDDRPITKWVVWDGKELISYGDDEFIDAYHTLINGQKERRIQNKLRYWTSPLAVSAILALALCVLIAILELAKYQVPDQLWSIFTAVIAFYFGRESSRRNVDFPGGE